ncbi:MAG TPA: hypothetical protein VD927_01385 [Chryseosolibacter sp.]|nr:hypothetical protein [Chryseosolibacter sp.]
MRLLIVVIILSISSDVFAQTKRGNTRASRNHEYEAVDFEDIMRRYLQKDTSHPLEGIYSISCVITKTSKPFLSDVEKEKVVSKQDNYARVAILKDHVGSKRDFIEISLSYREMEIYPIMGELSMLSEGKGYIYSHTEPDGSVITFSMLNESSELLEGVYSKIEKRKTITYHLSYLKIFPKAEAVVSTD